MSVINTLLISLTTWHWRERVIHDRRRTTSRNLETKSRNLTYQGKIMGKVKFSETKDSCHDGHGFKAKIKIDWFVACCWVNELVNYKIAPTKSCCKHSSADQAVKWSMGNPRRIEDISEGLQPFVTPKLKFAPCFSPVRFYLQLWLLAYVLLTVHGTVGGISRIARKGRVHRVHPHTLSSKCSGEHHNHRLSMIKTIGRWTQGCWRIFKLRCRLRRQAEL